VSDGSDRVAGPPTGTGAEGGATRRRVTIGAAIADGTARLAAAGSESARLDAEVLLGHVLGVDRINLAAYPEVVLGDGHLHGYAVLLDRRAAGEPVAYIRELKEFYGLALHVDPRVLIPRPESEALVEAALDRISRILTGRRDAAAGPFLVWDLGTGSGAVAVAIAAALRRRRYGDAVRIHASDISDEAIRVAVENAVSHGVADLMSFAVGDLAAADAGPGRPVDLLVANLPYVPTSSLPGLPVAASFEPTLALDGGEDGLEVVRRLLPELPGVLASGGAALLEIGADQGEATASAVAERLPGWSVATRPDLSGAPRVAVVERVDA
jgi:release factor glutamine methyltransferase